MHEWKINELNKKTVFSKVTLSAFEEQEKNFTKVLAMYNKTSKKAIEELKKNM